MLMLKSRSESAMASSAWAQRKSHVQSYWSRMFVSACAVVVAAELVAMTILLASR